jgi:hypothetical protein
MTEYEKELQHDMVMLSDSWTDKLIAAGTRCTLYRTWKQGVRLAKREDQMLTRMDRNFGDSM